MSSCKKHSLCIIGLIVVAVIGCCLDKWVSSKQNVILYPSIFPYTLILSSDKPVLEGIEEIKKSLKQINENLDEIKKNQIEKRKNDIEP